MLASLALPDVPYHALPLVEEDLVDLLRQHLDKNPGGCEGVTARDVAEVLLKFYDDGYALHCHREWLCSAFQVPQKYRAELDSLRSHVHEQVHKIVEDFMADLQEQSLTGTVASKFPLHVLSACALQRGLLKKHAPKAKRAEVRVAPMLRKHLNSMGELGKSYLPVDRCGELSELAADKLPAFYNRLLAECRTANSDGAEQPVVHSSDLMVPVASPPVMCWLCGDGFTHTDALVKHCKANHGDYAECRKRLFWQAQQEGLKKLLPYVKRHLVQAASFFQAYSVPGTMCLGWQLALCSATLRGGLRGVRSQRLDGEPLSSAPVEGGHAFEKRWRDHSWTWLYATPGSCGGPVLWEPWCH